VSRVLVIEASAWQPDRFERMPELVALPVPSARFIKT
jgi:hypothetical protein